MIFQGGREEEGGGKQDQEIYFDVTLMTRAEAVTVEMRFRKKIEPRLEPRDPEYFHNLSLRCCCSSSSLHLKSKLNFYLILSTY